MLRLPPGFTVCLLLAALAHVCGPAAAEEPASQASDAAPLADIPGVLPPDAARSESDADRVSAAAHFAQARILAHRDDRADALRHYQRAWRYDPTQTGTLREIVSLAFELRRHDEAARYAVLSAEAEPADAILLRRLAMHLTGQRDWRRALALYEKSLALAGHNADQPLDLGEVTIRFEMGRLYYLAGDFAKAADSFALVQAALSNPRSPLSAQAKDVLLAGPAPTYALWAEAFLEAKRYDEAAASFEKSHEAGAAGGADDAAKAKVELAMNLARVELARGNSAAALARLDDYFAAKSADQGIEPYELLGQLFARDAADPSEAKRRTLAKLESLRTNDPDNGSLALALGLAYFDAGRLDDSQRLLQAALAARPTGAAYRQLVDIYRQQQQPDKLLAVLSRLASETGSLDALGDAGQALARDEAVVAKLIDQTRRQHQEQPDKLAEGELLAAALVAREAGQWDAADELLGAALAAKPAAANERLLTWGLALLQADQYDRSAAALQRIVDQQPASGKLASVYFYLAAALELAGRTDEAVAAARKSAELSPANARFAAREAWIMYHAQRPDAARLAYQQLVERHAAQRDDADAQQIVREARLALSHLELTRGDFPAAVEWLEQVLDEFPEDVAAGNDLGYLWADRGEHLARSLGLIERAVAAQPENTAYRDSLGWALFRLGRHAEAQRELAAAAAGEDADGVVLEHWAEVLAKLGRENDALAALKRAEAAFQRAERPEELQRVRKKITESNQ